jgi:hypothetical protein
MTIQIESISTYWYNIIVRTFLKWLIQQFSHHTEYEFIMNCGSVHELLHALVPPPSVAVIVISVTSNRFQPSRVASVLRRCRSNYSVRALDEDEKTNYTRDRWRTSNFLLWRVEWFYCTNQYIVNIERLFLYFLGQKINVIAIQSQLTRTTFCTHVEIFMVRIIEYNINNNVSWIWRSG